MEGNASGSLNARMATYCAVHFPIPGTSHRRARKTSESTTPSKLIFPSETARASARIVSARCAGKPMLATFASASTAAAGNKCVIPLAAGSELSESSCQPSRKGCCTPDRDLLAENCPDRQLEAVPAARHAQSRSGLNPLFQLWIDFQALANIRPVRIQIKQIAIRSVIRKRACGSPNCTRAMSASSLGSRETST